MGQADAGVNALAVVRISKAVAAADRHISLRTKLGPLHAGALEAGEEANPRRSQADFVRAARDGKEPTASGTDPRQARRGRPSEPQRHGRDSQSDCLRSHAFAPLKSPDREPAGPAGTTAALAPSDRAGPVSGWVKRFTNFYVIATADCPAQRCQSACGPPRLKSLDRESVRRAPLPWRDPPSRRLTPARRSNRPGNPPPVW